MINYTSAEKVLTQISGTILENESKQRILSWVYQAYQGLELPQSNQSRCCIYTVKNHKTQLCSDIKSIQLVTLFNEESTPFTLEAFMEQENDCNGNPLLNTELFTVSQEFIDSFIPLKYIGNSKYVDSSCCNQYCHECNNTFSVDENRILHTNIKDGQLCVMYNSHVRDEEGNLLIIDNPTVIQYLSSYASYQHLYERAMREERIIGLMDREFQRMNALYRKARGTAIMKSVNYKSLAELTTESFDALMFRRYERTQ